MIIELETCSRVTFITADNLQYDVLPLPNSRLAVPKDVVYLKVKLFDSPKSNS